MRPNLSTLPPAIFLFLVCLSFVFICNAGQAYADTIAGMRIAKQADRDYTLEGEVVTIWEDSFLLKDDTGQIVVDIRPRSTSALKLAGRDYVLVSGRMMGDVFRPMVLTKGDGTSTSFNAAALLPELPKAEVDGNTARYRFAPPESANKATPSSSATDSASSSASQPPPAAPPAPPSGSAP